MDIHNIKRLAEFNSFVRYKGDIIQIKSDLITDLGKNSLMLFKMRDIRVELSQGQRLKVLISDILDLTKIGDQILDDIFTREDPYSTSSLISDDTVNLFLSSISDDADKNKILDDIFSLEVCIFMKKCQSECSFTEFLRYLGADIIYWNYRYIK